MNEIEITSADVETISASDLLESSAKHLGVADGEEVIDSVGVATGEKVVFEYDEDDNFIGWHKEALK